MKKLFVSLAACALALTALAQYTPTIKETVAALSGSVVTSATTTATETAGYINKTTITLDDLVVVVDGSSGDGWGTAEVYKFPEGRTLVLGVLVENFDITCVNTSNVPEGTGSGSFALGTAATADNSLTGTEVNLTPSSTITSFATPVDSALAASAQFDGTSTTNMVVLNVLIDDADIAAPETNKVDATITINWIDLGDY